MSKGRVERMRRNKGETDEHAQGVRHAANSCTKGDPLLSFYRFRFCTELIHKPTETISFKLTRNKKTASE